LLNKIRDILNLEKVGALFASTGVSANSWTFLSLCALSFAGILYATSTYSSFASLYYVKAISSSLVLIGGFFDMVDGSVARITKQVSPKGSFLDSTIDRISESIIFIGIAIGHLADPVLCLLAMSSSFLVSYVRAKAESLDVQLSGVGVGERAERLLILAAAGFIPISNSIQWGVILVTLVSGFTVIHRAILTSKRLSKPASRTTI
jgi:archaetidylinositol phosphate synthase